MIDRQHVTGLVLCGGRGLRMGGVDKGLQAWRGTTLAAHALQRLAPQAGPLAINANRNLETYAALGVPVWPDTLGGHAGPLAGFLTGLTHATTPFLLTVPCDAPRFPGDLAARLGAALTEGGADLALPRCPGPDGPQTQPVVCLMRASLRASLAAFLDAGGRKVGAWLAAQHSVEVDFADADAFLNVNTQDALRQAEALPDDPGADR